MIHGSSIDWGGKPMSEQMIKKPRILNDGEIMFVKAKVATFIASKGLQVLPEFTNYDKVLLQVQDDYCYKEMREQFISELDRCFTLAPKDDSYLRILVKDLLEHIRTGKTRKQRADEKFQTGLEEG